MILAMKPALSKDYWPATLGYHAHYSTLSRTVIVYHTANYICLPFLVVSIQPWIRLRLYQPSIYLNKAILAE